MEVSFSTFPLHCLGTPALTSGLNAKNVAITFDDGTTADFDQDFLLKIPYFKEVFKDPNSLNDNVTYIISLFSKADIDLILSLFYDIRHLASAVDQVHLVDPNFYEHLEKIIAYFLGEEATTAKAMIAEQMQSLPYAVSLELLTKFQQKGDLTQPLPFFIAAAQKVVGFSLGYKEISQYEEQLLSVRDCHYHIANTWGDRNLFRNMQKVQNENEPLQDFLKKTLYMETSKNQGLNWATDLFKKCEAKEFSHLLQVGIDLSEIHRQTVLQLKPSKLLELVNEKIPDENISALCQQAMAKVAFKIYEANVFLTLQYQIRGALISRREFLFAPLFAYYDLEPKSDFNAFQHSMFKTNFFYQFAYPDNATLMNLEEEIRNDLNRNAERPDRWQGSKSGFSLPSPMFTDLSQLPAVPQKINISLEIKELREAVLPFFFYCRHESEHSAAQCLLTHWGWDNYGIAPNDLTFVLPPSRFDKRVADVADEDKVFIRGAVKIKNGYGGSPISKKYEFYFSLDDFKPIVLHHSIAPTFESSDEFMKEQWLIRKISSNKNAMLDFNFFDYVGLQKIIYSYPRQ